MATYDQLRVRADSVPIWWLELAGWRDMFVADHITNDLLASQFTDGYTDTQTVWRILKKPEHSSSKRFEPMGGISADGGFDVSLIDFRTEDYPHGYLTWVLGRNRPTIARTRITADVPLHAGGAGHSWGVEDASVFIAGHDLYRGLETINPDSLDVADPDFLVDVLRSRWLSEASPHRGQVFGSQTIYPYVTDHPTVWRGRIVTLFHTYMDGAGVLASSDNSTDTVRAEARKIRGLLAGIAFNPTGFRLRCRGIESLLDRQICRKLPKARLGNPIVVESERILLQNDGICNAAADDPGTVMDVVQVDVAGGGAPIHFPIFVPQVTYTPEELVQAINDVLAAGPTGYGGETFSGQLQLELDDERLTARYLTDGVTPMACTVFLDETLDGRQATTWTLYWGKVLGAQGQQTIEVTTPPGAGPTGNTEYAGGLDRYGTEVIAEGANNLVLQVDHGPGDSPIGDFAADFGGIGGAQGGYVAIQSEAGVEIVGVTEVDTTNSLIQVDRRVSIDRNRALSHIAQPGNPVTVRRVYVTPQSASAIPVRAILYPLLSTGLAAYNDADYDTLAESVGAALPNETRDAGTATDEGLVDVASFERFFNEVGVYFDGFTREVIEEATTLREWLTKRLAFLGGAIVVENGRIGARRTVAATLNASREILPHHIVRPIESTGETRLDRLVGALQYRWRWLRSVEQFRENVRFQAGADAPNEGGAVVELADKGISTDTAQLQLLAQEVLAEYAVEPTEYSVILTRAQRDLEPGMTVRFTDWGGDSGAVADESKEFRGLPNLEGTRGHDAAPMLVISASVAQATGQVTVTLLRLGRKRGGFSPSAWIETFVINTPAAGTTRIVYTDREFSDLDAEGFTIGEKVQVVRISAPTGAVQASTGHTISAIDTTNRRIEITPNVAGAGIVSTETLVLIHDPYQTASQTDSAKGWAAIGDASGDIGDTGDDCYDW